MQYEISYPHGSKELERYYSFKQSDGKWSTSRAFLLRIECLVLQLGFHPLQARTKTLLAQLAQLKAGDSLIADNVEVDEPTQRDANR